MPFLTRLALRLNDFSERYVPSAFVIAVLLTVFTFVLALSGGTSPGDCVRFWGDGFWELLKFGMQMCLILMTGSILADAPRLRAGLDAAARVPRSPRGAVAFTALMSMALCWVHWGLGMIASAFLARRVALRHPRADYRLLVAVAYFGMGAVWHAGLSGSAPLLVATPKHFLEDKIGIIPLSATIFTPFNLVLVAATAVLLTALAWAMTPPPECAFVLPEETRRAFLEEERVREEPPAPSAWIAFLERTWAVNGLVAALGAWWFLQDTAARGWTLTFDKLNFVFLVAALALHPSPAAFARSAEKAASFVHGIIVQFPFYAGIYGVIKGAHLDARIGAWFVELAGPGTFPLAVYWYSGILNYFIPSGGSKWAVEAPFVIEASARLGVPYAKTVLAYAWGDMVTDMMQPFWCLPLLAVAKLDFKDILGYEAVAFVACALLGSAAFLLFA